MMMLICIKQHLSNTEAQLMRILSNNTAELKKTLLIIIKKRVYQDAECLPNETNCLIC